jgi:hypothetical protein
MFDDSRMFSFAALLFTVALSCLSGCAGCNGVDAGCRTDDDCRTGRICSDGVCTDPDFVLNNDHPDGGNNTPSDASGGEDADNGGIDAANNVLPDMPPSDGGAPDMTTPDMGSPDDGTLPDMGTTDSGMADTGTPDMSTTGPRIRVTPPDEIDYGLVTVGSSVDTPLLVENIGDEDLVITSLDLRARPSQGFDVAPVVDGAAPVTIPPGGSETYVATFAPQVVGNYGNDIDIDSNDPMAMTYSVALSGQGRNPTNNASCLTASPDVVDFGIVDPGMSRTRTVTLSNCGPDDVTITEYSIVNAPSGPFSWMATNAPPDVLSSGESTSVDVIYAPTDLQDSSDELRILSDAQLGSQIDIDLLGTGGGCATATATAESVGDPTDSLRSGRVPVVVGDTAQLDGSESDSPSGQIEYAWTLTSAPAGSSASLSDPTAESPTLAPDVAGTYVIELAVTDPTTGNPGCTTDTVEIVALDELPDLRVDVSWAADHDMDLHFLRSDATGTFPDFGDPVDDAHYDNLSPDWNVAGDGTDDPFHFGDDTDGFGPETLVLAEFEAGRTYRVVVQLARLDGRRPFDWNANATLTIRSPSGVPMVHNESRQFTRQENGLYWIVWEIDGATGAVTTLDTTQN